MRGRIGVVRALLLAGVAGIAVGPSMGATRGITKGALAVQVARAAGIALPASGAETAAAEALRKAGIDLGTDLGAPATELTLARVGRAVGQDIATSRPGAPATPGLAQALVQSIKGSLIVAAAAAKQNGTTVTHVSCQGRESRSSRQGVPASPSNLNATAPPCGEPIP